MNNTHNMITRSKYKKPTKQYSLFTPSKSKIKHASRLLNDIDKQNGVYCKIPYIILFFDYITEDGKDLLTNKPFYDTSKEIYITFLYMKEYSNFMKKYMPFFE